MNCLGGIATAGWHGHICCYCSWDHHVERVVGGTCYELVDRLVQDGYGTYDGFALDFEVERLKFVLENMVKEIGNITLLYYTQFSDVILQDGKITHVIIQNKDGRQAIETKMTVDATGDGDVAARSGAPFEKGRDHDGGMQPMTLMFQMGGLNHDAFWEFETKGYQEKYGKKRNDADRSVWLEAQQNGDMEPFQNHTCGWWWCATRPDQMGVNFTHIPHMDPTKAEDLTYATIEGRRQAYHSIDVFRKYIPGMENIWMSHTAALIGTRESRRILGEAYLTGEDMLREREFEDSIGYGCFFIDVHNCTGPGMDTEAHYPREGFKYQIPYGVIVPQKVDNLLVAGRCISCDHWALGSLRVMPQCFIEGDAAGLAASLALDTDSTPRTVNVRELQHKLRNRGAILTEEDIVRDAKWQK